MSLCKLKMHIAFIHSLIYLIALAAFWIDCIIIQKKILKTIKKFQLRHRKRILEIKDVKEYLENFQKDFVFIPTDKASNNISIVCKGFYIKILLKEVRFFDNEKNKTGHIRK